MKTDTTVARGIQGIVIVAIALMVVFALMSFFSKSAMAEEASGQIIKELVADINDGISNFDTQTRQYGKDNKAIQKGLQQKYQKMEKTKDQWERRQLLAEMLVDTARLNQLDLQGVREYKNTIMMVLPKLKQLKSEMAKNQSMGFDNSGEFRDYKKAMYSMSLNASVFINNLHIAASSNEEKKELDDLRRTIDTTLAMYDKPDIQIGQNLEPISRGIKSLQHAFAQMESVERSLYNERLRLKVENLNQISNTVLENLALSRLDVKDINELPSIMLGGIQNRDNMLSQGKKLVTNTSSASSYSSHQSKYSIEDMRKMNNELM